MSGNSKFQYRIYLKIESGDTGASNDNMFTYEDESEFFYKDILIENMNIDLTKYSYFCWGNAGCWKQVVTVFQEFKDNNKITFGNFKNKEGKTFYSLDDFLTSDRDTKNYTEKCDQYLKKEILKHYIDELPKFRNKE